MKSYFSLKQMISVKDAKENFSILSENEILNGGWIVVIYDSMFKRQTIGYATEHLATALSWIDNYRLECYDYFVVPPFKTW